MNKTYSFASWITWVVLLCILPSCASHTDYDFNKVMNNENLKKDMADAASQCPKTSPQGQLKIEMACLFNRMRPVWFEYYPGMLAEFDDFWDAESRSAQQYDDEKITLEDVQTNTQINEKNFESALKLRSDYWANNPANDTHTNHASEEDSGSSWETLGDALKVVGAVAAVAGIVTLAVLAAKHSNGGGGGSCCKVCNIGKACGDTCITQSDICHVPAGCACNQY